MTLPVGKWFRLLEVKKEGYQFRETAQFKQEFGGDIFGTYAKKFTADNPLVIRGWKREAQSELTYVGGTVYFPDDIEQCTLELVQPNQKNNLVLPLILELKLETSFVRSVDNPNPNQKYLADQWGGEISMRGAQLQETNDLFLNRAPTKGYKDAIIYPMGTLYPHKTEKRVFIRGQSAEYFGGGLFFLAPDNGTKAKQGEVNHHEVAFQMWFNLDGSTNVMRNRSQTIWDYLDRPISDRIYCRETPHY